VIKELLLSKFIAILRKRFPRFRSQNNQGQINSLTNLNTKKKEKIFKFQRFEIMQTNSVNLTEVNICSRIIIATI
jgi:hypothetical protein